MPGALALAQAEDELMNQPAMRIDWRISLAGCNRFRCSHSRSSRSVVAKPQRIWPRNPSGELLRKTTSKSTSPLPAENTVHMQAMRKCWARSRKPGQHVLGSGLRSTGR